MEATQKQHKLASTKIGNIMTSAAPPQPQYSSYCKIISLINTASNITLHPTPFKYTSQKAIIPYAKILDSSL
eukprot:scaffold203045_cov66-Cyclotella_meneghiniana.AAC.2